MQHRIYSIAEHRYLFLAANQSAPGNGCQQGRFCWRLGFATGELNGFQIGQNSFCCLITVGRGFGQKFESDRSQVGGQAGIVPAG